MKKILLPVCGFFLSASLSCCGPMEYAFKAGFIIALIIAAVIGLLIWILHMTIKTLAHYFPAVRAFRDGFWDELSL